MSLAALQAQQTAAAEMTAAINLAIQAEQALETATAERDRIVTDTNAAVASAQASAQASVEAATAAMSAAQEAAKNANAELDAKIGAFADSTNAPAPVPIAA